MSSNEPPNPWERLVDAARETGAAETKLPIDPPPPGFISRLSSMRRTLAQFARTLLLRRWSAVFAVAALVIYLILYFILKSNPSEVAPASPLPLPPLP